MGKLQKAKDGIAEVYQGKGLTLSQRGNAATPPDEYYTRREDVERILVTLAGRIGDKVVYLPFDRPESEFCRVCDDMGIPYVNSWNDYAENLEYMREHADTHVIVSNPPFSLWRQIVSNLNKTGIKYYLINNLLNANHFPQMGLYGSYLGSMEFKNGKKVPCCMMSNDDIRALDFKHDAKARKPKEIDGIRFYPTKREWLYDGAPAGVYINSCFPIYAESMNYDFSGPYDIQKHFNVFFVERRTEDGKGKYSGIHSQRKPDRA